MSSKTNSKLEYNEKKKSCRLNRVCKNRNKKRRFQSNQYTDPRHKTFVSASARKLNSSSDFDVGFDNEFDNVFIAFSLVFSTLATMIKCKQCDSDIKFTRKNVIGLGFQLVINCSCDKTKTINSCSRDYKTYEINRKFVLVMRLLGVGLSGINMFCGLMDLAEHFSSHLYYTAIDSIHIATKSFAKAVMQKAGKEEKKMNAEKNLSEDELTVSGNGTWAKRGFSSLLGICTLIGKLSGKIVDIFVSSKNCKACEINKKRLAPTEFLIWQESEHAEECSINYIGSSGGMEVQGVVEMFRRSPELHNAKYAKYIGDGDSKTFVNLVESDPYPGFVIQKVECVLHVGKRMFRRLKDVKKTLTEIKKLKKKEEAKKNEGEPAAKKPKRHSKSEPPTKKRTELTGKIMKEISLFYGLAIQNNPDDKIARRNAIWAGFYHRISTNKKPQHQFCDPSWCKYLTSQAENTEYDHKPSLSDEVQEYIKPVFEDLTKDELLDRCLGRNTQNNNELFNSTIWALVPKHMFCGKKVVELSAWMAVCVFNEGSKSLLKVFESLGLQIGRLAYNYVHARDDERIRRAEKRSTEQSKEARQAKKKQDAKDEALYEEAFGLLYGPGIAD